MPAAARKGDLSTGHGCFPPTICRDPVSTRTFINSLLAQIQSSTHLEHRCGTVHLEEVRKTNNGSQTVFIENKRAQRIGDSIICGDTVGQGSDNVFIGG